MIEDYLKYNKIQFYTNIIIFICFSLYNNFSYGELEVTAAKVIKIDGKARIYEPWEFGWKRIVDVALIKVGSLINIQEGSKLEIKIMMNNSDQKLLRLTGPTIVRLSKDLIRQVKKKEIFLNNDQRSYLLRQEKRFASSKYLDLKNAFEKTDVRTNFTEELRKNAQKVLGLINQESLLLSPKKKIRILTPEKSSIIVVDKIPSKLFVRWSSNIKNKQIYEVYLWHRKEIPSQPNILTRDKYAWLDINRLGKHWLMVKTRDSRYQSEMIAVIIKPEANLERSMTNLTKKDDHIDFSKVTPGGKSLYLTDKKAEIVFCHNNVASYGKGFILQISKKKSKSFSSHVFHDRKCLIQNLPQGSYEWKIVYGDYKKQKFEILKMSKDRSIIVSTSESFFSNAKYFSKFIRKGYKDIVFSF